MRRDSDLSMRRWVVLCLIMLLLVHKQYAQDLEPIAKEIGATFCTYLAYKNQIPRRYFNDCGEPNCDWESWNDALVSNSSAKRRRIVLSYGHNGFGNQLWEHSAGFMIAESLKAQLMIAVIPDELSPGGYIPPNSWQGMSAMERMLPKEFQYEMLPADSPIRKLCDSESFIIADRPIDWRDKNYTSNFKRNLLDLINDPKPRCVKLLGYFQNLPLCAEDTKKLWTPRLFQNATIRPGENDISIYLRCLPRHYHFNGKAFYENILNHTVFDNVWLFQAPECPNKLNENPSKDGLVASVIRLLKETYNAKRWPGLEGTDGTAMLLHDLAGLAMSKKLILPVSSWAFWGGMFSNASEIHVNAPPHHQVMYGMPQYVYHNEKTGEYFGQYHAAKNDIIYRTNLTNHHHHRLRAKAIMATHSNNTASSVTYIEHKAEAAAPPVIHSPAVRMPEFILPAKVIDLPAAPLSTATAGPPIIHSPAVRMPGFDLPAPPPVVISTATAATPSPPPPHSEPNSTAIYATGKRLPVIYVFTVVPAICPYGLPAYIRTAIEQGIFTQPDCDVILVSNFAECTTLRDSVKSIPGLVLVDSLDIISNRTKEYKNVSSNMFQTDGGGELWMTSALRFFILEDLMLHTGYTELIHVEADNMIYGRYTSLLPVLRSGYKGMAATPLNVNKSFITASVMWISSLKTLLDFNDFLLALGSNAEERWKKYLTWLRPYACCRAGGVDPDAEGNGIKPFAINEMSMLGYYHEINPDGFKIFPVVPAHSYNLNKYVVNMSLFGPHGEQVGPPTGHGVWDPNSWGQLIGGTATKKGRDKGFTDPSHIAGQAIRMNQCVLQMLCGNQTVSPYASAPMLKLAAGGTISAAAVNDDGALLDVSQIDALQWWRTHQDTQCYTAPFARCSDDSPWTPLWNLHVHSKHTQDYRSVACPCPDAQLQ